jgi:hypothetical protein
VKLLIGKKSQCSNCETVFSISSDEVQYCSDKCKEEHNLFKVVGRTDLQRLPFYELHIRCSEGEADALKEWERRWENSYPRMGQGRRPPDKPKKMLRLIKR